GRDADDGATRHRRMLIKNVFDFGRIDVLATTDDHVLDAVGDIDKTVFIHVATVASVHPTVPQRLRRKLRLVPVALHHDRATDQDFTGLAARQLVVIFIGDDDFTGDNRAPGRTDAAIALAFLVMVLRAEIAGP